MTIIKTKFWLNLNVRDLSADGIVAALCILTFPPIAEGGFVETNEMTILLGWPFARTQAALAELYDAGFILPTEDRAWVLLDDLLKFSARLPTAQVGDPSMAA